MLGSVCSGLRRFCGGYALGAPKIFYTLLGMLRLPCTKTARQFMPAMLAERERGRLGIVVMPAAIAYKVVHGVSLTYCLRTIIPYVSLQRYNVYNYHLQAYLNVIFVRK